MDCFRRFAWLALTLWLAACAPLAAPSATPTRISLPVQPPPAMFSSNLLNPVDSPRAYLQDTCQYLRYRWNPWNAQPGTVALVVRFAEVYRGQGSESGVEINTLKRMMLLLREQEFETITTKQLRDFLERNVRIPQRSVLIVRDGYFPFEDYDKYFSEYWDAWGWTIANGWLSREGLTRKDWEAHQLLERSGLLDHQAMGRQPETYFTDDSSKVIINREMGAASDGFQKYFDKKPLAFVWNGGGFGLRPARAARQMNYQLGFTYNPRGPVMFNWIPQADAQDPARPTLLPEGYIGDPLMTLPRYHPREVFEQLDNVRLIGNAAKEYAEAHKAEEIDYYNTVCLPNYGPLPSP